MARIRTIKPDFFFDEELADLPPQTRLFFIGLWCQADRRGRLEDRPSKLKAQILPYEKTDPDQLLNSLHPKFLVRYEIEGKKYLWIRSFEKHQRPHHTEAESCIPEFKGEVPVSSPLEHGENPPVLKEVGKEKGRERRRERNNGFDPLWSAYIGDKGPKAKALKAYNATNPPSEALQALQAQIAYKAECDKRGVFRATLPYLHRWITERRWEDELPPFPETQSERIWREAQEEKRGDS